MTDRYILLFLCLAVAWLLGAGVVLGMIAWELRDRWRKRGPRREPTTSGGGLPRRDERAEIGR